VYATYELCRYDCPHSENDEKTNISYSSACIAVLLLQPDKRAYTDDDKIIWISNELEEKLSVEHERGWRGMTILGG